MRFILKIVLFGLVFSSVVAQSSKKRIELSGVLENELKGVLEASEVLGSYMYGNKDPLVKTQIEQLRGQLRKAQGAIKPEENQGGHISRILSTIDQELVQAKTNAGEQKTKYLQSAFRQIVMLFQSYKIEAPYKVFFCKKDRSVWLQKDKKPQNPFEGDSNCGRVVN